MEQVIAPIEESISNFHVDEQKPESTNVTVTELETEVEDLVSYLDESELEEFDSELATHQNSIEDTDEVDSNEENINPFIDSSEPLQSDDNRDDSNLAVVDELIGAFDESELEMFEQKSLPKTEEADVRSEFELKENQTSDEESESLANFAIEHERDTEEDNYLESLEEETSAIALEEDNSIQEFNFDEESVAKSESKELMMGLDKEEESTPEFSLEEESAIA